MAAFTRGGGEIGQHSRLLVPADLALVRVEGCDSLLEHTIWAEAAMTEWGFCGLGCVSDGVVTGFALVSPALHVPRDHPLGPGANADAAALIALVDDGCGRRLIQSLAARLVGRRRIVAIDAASSYEGTPLAPSYDWLDASGFHPIPGDPIRYRLELSGTRSWLPDLAPVVQRLRQLLRPTSPPEPVGRYELSRVEG